MCASFRRSVPIWICALRPMDSIHVQGLIWKLLTPAVAGIASTHHAALLINDRMLVFGGYTGVFPMEYIPNLREYDAVLNTWREVTLSSSREVPGRSQHSFSYSAASKTIFVYGGMNRYSVLDDAFSTGYHPIL